VKEEIRLLEQWLTVDCVLKVCEQLVHSGGGVENYVQGTIRLKKEHFGN
jgi:hypothetical protein